jgi:hypothetical protein
VILVIITDVQLKGFMLKEHNVYGSVHRNNILIYIQQYATLHSSFYLETVLHVSGGNSTHHQERIQLYSQHLRRDKYQMLQIQLFAFLMMGGGNTRNM